MLSPTDYCNLSCGTCWRLKKDAKFSQPSFNFLKKTIREAKGMGVEIIDLTGGGEPFIRKDILELMKFIKKLEMKGTITTNSTLIKRDGIKNIIGMGWDEINFSLDGSTAKINDHIRGKGSYKKVLDTIGQFQENNGNSKPVLRLSFTITRTNLDDIPDYIKLAKNLGIRNINFSTLFEWNSNKDFWLKADKKKVEQRFKKSSRLAKKMGIRTNLEAVRTFGIWEHKPPKSCFAPWYMLFINASKEAMVCCTLASLYQSRLGKVDSLEKIWHSKKMEMLRQRMRKRIFFKECERCLPEFMKIFNQMYSEMENAS